MSKATKNTTTGRPVQTNYDFRTLWDAFFNARQKPFRISISNCNSKMGQIPAFSLLPGPSCSAEACHHCLKEGCYAVKSAFQHGYTVEKNTTLNAWARNTAAAVDYLPLLEDALDKYFDGISAPRFFRVHVSGDFISVAYAEMWRRIIVSHPGTRFLFFTKQWEILRRVPFLGIDNLSPMLSGWTGCDVPQDLVNAGYRVAWCDDGFETRIPVDAMECPGDCEHCGFCWNAYKIGKDAFFHKH